MQITINEPVTIKCQHVCDIIEILEFNSQFDVCVFNDNNAIGDPAEFSSDNRLALGCFIGLIGEQPNMSIVFVMHGERNEYIIVNMFSK